MPATPLPNHLILRNVFLGVILVGTIGLAAAVTHYRPGLGILPPGADPASLPVVTYDNQQFHTSQPYKSPQQYLDDPDRIAPFDRERAANQVIHKRVRMRGTAADIFAGIKSLEFPGFELTSRTVQAPDGQVLILALIEIPYAHVNRVLLYRGDGETYDLIDDRQMSETLEIRAPSLANKRIAYLGPRGETLLAVPLPDISTRP